MAENPPYLVSPSSLKKALDKIRTAATPPRVTGDFVETVIGIKGGTGRALIPFLKRIGFVKPDGTPTELYNQFRNPGTSGKAVAEAFRTGFSGLYQYNEYIHQAKDEDLKGAIVQATGLAHDDRVAAAILGTLKALKGYANFDASGDDEQTDETTANGERNGGESAGPERQRSGSGTRGLNLSYTINLNLPASDDIRVFDAIFRSLRENLLKE